LVTGLTQSKQAIYLSDRPVITVRTRRAPAVDGAWPEHLERSWIEYLEWQRQLLGLDHLHPEEATDTRALSAVQQDPAASLAVYPEQFAGPRSAAAYVYFLKRQWFHGPVIRVVS
jgi:hypothetical protein